MTINLFIWFMLYKLSKDTFCLDNKVVYYIKELQLEIGAFSFIQQTKYLCIPMFRSIVEDSENTLKKCYNWSNNLLSFSEFAGHFFFLCVDPFAL